jgi:hypothetical protein
MEATEASTPSDETLGDAPSGPRAATVSETLPRVFLRPIRKIRPSRNHQLVVALHRRAARSKPR